MREEIYKTFFMSIEGITDLKFRKTKHIRLSDDLVASTEAITRSLSASSRNLNIVLIIEVLDKEANPHLYDDLCTCLVNAITHKNFPKPWCLAVVTPYYDLFQKSVILRHRLIELCDKQKTGLILFSSKKGNKPIIICQGKLPKTWVPPIFDTHTDGEKEKLERKIQTIDLDIIAKDFSPLFGHFKLKVNGKVYHVPSVASVRRLVRDNKFTNFLFDKIVQLLGSEKFMIHPIGIPLGGVNELSLALVQKDSESAYHYTGKGIKKGFPVVIMCDFLSNIYPIREIVEKYKNDGVIKIALIGIARYKDFIEVENIPSWYLINTEHISHIEDDKTCQFCTQNVRVIEGENFRDFERSIVKFDSYTFWEFIRQNKKYYQLGHWASDRTINHYHFRIITKTLFNDHSYDLSLRIRNILMGMNLLPQWIKKIVCTEGEESNILSHGLADVFGLSYDDIIQIPRKYFKSIAGKDIDEKLIYHINKTVGEQTLRGKNVLIVDQAAHHFKTLSALKRVCEYYGCDIIAFTVVIDRTRTDFSTGEYLYDSHYISLYSWPSPPRLEHQCPCKMVINNEILD